MRWGGVVESGLWVTRGSEGQFLCWELTRSRWHFEQPTLLGVY